MALTTVAYPHQPANDVLLGGYVGQGQPAPDGGEAKLREEREGAIVSSRLVSSRRDWSDARVRKCVFWSQSTCVYLALHPASRLSAPPPGPCRPLPHLPGPLPRCREEEEMGRGSNKRQGKDAAKATREYPPIEQLAQ